MPLDVQAKLLRVLQEREVRRVGGDAASRTVDVRVVAATNRDLERDVQRGPLPRGPLLPAQRRSRIQLPPLRERAEDIAAARRSTSSRRSRRADRQQVAGVRRRRDARCSAYAWPGNVRELENALEYATAVCKRHTIFPEDFPATIQGHAYQPEERAQLHTLGADGLRCVLDENRWNRCAAARSLGVSRTTLWRRMRELGLVA